MTSRGGVIQETVDLGCEKHICVTFLVNTKARAMVETHTHTGQESMTDEEG